jgi:hypothetical protein
LLARSVVALNVHGAVEQHFGDDSCAFSVQARRASAFLLARTETRYVDSMVSGYLPGDVGQRCRTKDPR